MEGYTEKGPERILDKGEVLEAISRYAEGAIVARELADEQGLYLLEAEVAGDQPGETIQYMYMRAGTFPNQNATLETAIHRIFYQDGIPVGGDKVAIFNSAKGAWEDVN